MCMNHHDADYVASWNQNITGKRKQICIIDHSNVHPLSVTALSLLSWGFVGVCCWSQSQLSVGEGRVLPGREASSSHGPPCKVPTACQEQCGVQFDMQLSSAQSWDLNHQPCASRRLYLSYSRPLIIMFKRKSDAFILRLSTSSVENIYNI